MSEELASSVESAIQNEMGFRRLVVGTLLEVSQLVAELVVSLEQNGETTMSNPTLPEADREYYESKGRREVNVEKWERLLAESTELRQAAEDLLAAQKRYKDIERKIAEQAREETQ